MTISAARMYERSGNNAKTTALQLFIILGLIAASALLASLFIGVLAVLLVSLFGHLLTIGDIQTIINLFAFGAAVLITPMYFHAFFVSIFTKTDIRSWTRLCLRTLKSFYLKLCVLVLACTVIVNHPGFSEELCFS